METQVQVTERAIFARLSRKLKKEGQTLHRCRRDSRWFNDMGPYYTVDIGSNSVVDRGFSDLDEWAREIGVLKPYEQMVN
jgi:hypothetical protein